MTEKNYSAALLDHSHYMHTYYALTSVPLDKRDIPLVRQTIHQAYKRAVSLADHHRTGPKHDDIAMGAWMHVANRWLRTLDVPENKERTAQAAEPTAKPFTVAAADAWTTKMAAPATKDDDHAHLAAVAAAVKETPAPTTAPIVKNAKALQRPVQRATAPTTTA